jgi:hypothetical protein
MIFLLFLIFTLIKSKHYNYSSLFDKEPKVNIDFLFDPSYSENTLNFHENENSFSKYFYTYYETELPLINGAKMSCFIPNKIELNDSIFFQKNIKNIKNSNFDIEKIPENYANIFLKNIDNYCFNVNIERWYYKLCPSKVAIQTLSYKKLNEKTGKEEIEVNYLGFGRNYTNLSNEYEIYMKENGISFNQIEYEIHKNLFKNKILANYEKIIKIYDDEKFEINNKNNYFLYVKYDLNEFKKINEKIKINNEFNYDLNEYLKNFPNEKNIILERKIIKIINKNTFLIDDFLPKINFIDFYLKNSNFSSKFLTEDFFIYENYLFCKLCNLIKCLNENCFISNNENFNQRFKIIEIIDQFLVKIEKKLNFENTFYSLWISNEKNIIFGKGKVEIINNKELITKNSNLNELKIGDKILFINNNFKTFNKHLILFKFPLEKEKFTFCEIKEILNENHIKFDENKCEINETKINIEKYNFFIIKNINDNNNKNNNKNNNLNIIDFYNSNKNFNINHLSAITNYFPKNLKIFYKLPKNEFNFNFILKIIYKSKISNIHFYLSKNLEKLSENDYEIIINSKNGILIKQIKNNNDMSFYTNKRMNFFNNHIECQILFINNTIYFNSQDNLNDKNSSIKLKYNLITENNLKNDNQFYLILDLKQTQNIKIKSIFIKNYIEEKYLINIFFYEKLFYLNENSTFIDYFDSGDYCAAIKRNRRVKIEYKCDTSGLNDLIITKVEEDKKNLCVYNYYAKTKYLCNPEIIMKNIIKSTTNQVNCIPKNNKFNHNEQEFFSN